MQNGTPDTIVNGAGNIVPVSVNASSGQECVSALLDPASTAIWHSQPGESGFNEREEITFEFGSQRKLGGLIIDWGSSAKLNMDTPRQFEVLVPNRTGSGWRKVYGVQASLHHRTLVYLPGLETAQLKLRFTESSRGYGYGIRSVEFKPESFSSTASQFWSVVAGEAAPGCYPAGLSASAETGDASGSTLLCDNGALAFEQLGFSVEPFLRVGPKFHTWADAQVGHSVTEDEVKVPAVTRSYDGYFVTVSALSGVSGKRRKGASTPVTYLRFTVKNTSDKRVTGKLFAAIRPFVGAGRFSPIRSIEWSDGAVIVNRSKAVVPFTSPAPFGATTLDGGDISTHLFHNVFPAAKEANDDNGFASGALGFLVDLQPDAEQHFYVAVSDVRNVRRVGQPQRAFSGLPPQESKRKSGQS